MKNNDEDNFEDIDLTDENYTDAIVFSYQEVISALLEYSKYLNQKLETIKTDDVNYQDITLKLTNVNLRTINYKISDSFFELVNGNTFTQKASIGSLIEDSIALINIEVEMDKKFHEIYANNKRALDQKIKQNNLVSNPNLAYKLFDALSKLVYMLTSLKDRFLTSIGVNNEESRKKQLLFNVIDQIKPGTVENLNKSRAIIDGIVNKSQFKK